MPDGLKPVFQEPAEAYEPRGRLAAARQIRETAEPNWADIAYGLGYASQQHFITDFKTVLGATPVQYKNSVSTDQSP